MQISVLNVSIETKPTKTGKSYQQAEVAYKNLTFQGKVESKKLMSFGAQADAFKTMSNAQPGQVFNITVIKNDAGYNDWTKAESSAEGAPDTSPKPASAYARPAATSAATAPVRSSYETPEERAQRQVLIVRQSSLSTAADVLTTGAKTPPKSEEVISLAKEFEKYVFGTEPEDSGFDTMVDDSAEVM